MSVFIIISDSPSPETRKTNFGRSLKISRMTGTGTRLPDRDDILTYEVMYLRGTRPTTSSVIKVAMFPHRYGDNLTTLMAEALEALGDVGEAMIPHEAMVD